MLMSNGAVSLRFQSKGNIGPQRSTAVCPLLEWSPTKVVVGFPSVTEGEKEETDVSREVVWISWEHTNVLLSRLLSAPHYYAHQYSLAEHMFSDVVSIITENPPLQAGGVATSYFPVGLPP